MKKWNNTTILFGKLKRDKLKILLLDCNKVSEECFEKVKAAFCYKPADVVHKSLTQFGSKVDILSYRQVSDFLKDFSPLDAVLIADIFWPTGQNICQWCIDNNVKCFFWQHGQWIYTKNKKNPRFLPSVTFFLGENAKNECSQWSYGKRSQLNVTGSPRYDSCFHSKDVGRYVYFSPPAILEVNPSVTDRYNYEIARLLKQLKGLDDEVSLLIHPHYREGKEEELKSLFPKATFGYRKCKPVDLIKCATKVLTHRNSTTVLDGIACGKPVVLMNFGKHNKSCYSKGYFKDFALESDSPDHCVHNLKSEVTVEESGYQDRAREFIALGNASSRIVDNILTNTK